MAKIHFRNGFQEKIVKTNTLNNIIERSKYKNQRIDFLNIDVEGNELNVLKSLNFEKHKPSLICIEIHNHEEMYNQSSDYLRRNPIHKYLLKKRYKVVWKHEFSYIYKSLKK